MREQSCAWVTIEGLRDIKCDSRSLLTTRLKLFCYAYLLSISFEQFLILLLDTFVFAFLHCLPDRPAEDLTIEIRFSVPQHELIIWWMLSSQLLPWYFEHSLKTDRIAHTYLRVCCSFYHASLPCQPWTPQQFKKCIKRVWKGPTYLDVLTLCSLQ